MHYKTTELLKHFHLPVKISSRMLLVWIYFLSDFRLNLEKTKGFSAPTPVTKNEQKHLPKAARKRNLASITNTCYLRLQSYFLNTQHVLIMGFPPTITTPNIWENTTLNHTPVASQCILIAAVWNSTAYYLPKNRQDLKSRHLHSLCSL